MRLATSRLAGIVAVATLAAVLVFIGVRAAVTRGGDCTPDSVRTTARTLTLEGDPWSGYAAFRAPDFLRGSGYTFVYRTELDQAVRACDLTSGKADFLVTTIDQFLLTKPQGKIVGIIDQSSGADALVLDSVTYPYLRSLDRVSRLVGEYKARDKKPVIAFTGNSPSEFLLTEIANSSEDLRITDFELLSVDQSSTARQKLEKHEAAIAVLWEPDVSAVRSSGYSVAMSSRDFPDAIVDVLVASHRVIEKDPGAVQTVVSAFYQARRAALADSAKFEAFIAKDGGLSAGDVTMLLSGIRFYDAGEADRFLNAREWPLNQTRLEESLRAVGAILSLKDRSIQPGAHMWDGRFAQAAP
jgi:OOP family OmpA-OmpF porin